MMLKQFIILCVRLQGMTSETACEVFPKHHFIHLLDHVFKTVLQEFHVASVLVLYFIQQLQVFLT